MTYKLIVSRRANSQLAALERYIALAGSPNNAQAYVDAILEKCVRIAAAPWQGTARNDLLPGLRTTGFRNRVTIAFRVTSETVVIAGIFYAGRNFERLYRS